MRRPSRGALWFTALIVIGIAIALLTLTSRRGPRLTPYPNTYNGIHIGLVFDYWVNRGLPLGHHYDLNGKVDYVWGAEPPGTGGSATLGSAHLEAYVPFDLDWTGHSLRWFQTHHPSWVVYQCDSQGQPTLVPAWYPHGNDYGRRVPLDFGNPAVRAFETNYARQRLRLGYDGISVDDFTFTNFENRCGVYRHGQWASLGYPPRNGTNAKLTSDILGWLRYVRLHLQQSDPGTTLTVNFSTLYTLGAAVLPRILPYVDGVLDEQGFTYNARGRLTGRRWESEVEEAELVESRGKAFIAVANTRGRYFDETARDSEISWILSNYLLIKGSHTYTYVQGLSEGYVDLPQYHIPIGHPTSGRYLWQGVQARRYSGGLVLVNPSGSTSYDVSLGRPYTTMYGRATTAFVMRPATGVVLLRQG